MDSLTGHRDDVERDVLLILHIQLTIPNKVIDLFGIFDIDCRPQMPDVAVVPGLDQAELGIRVPGTDQSLQLRGGLFDLLDGSWSPLLSHR